MKMGMLGALLCAAAVQGAEPAKGAEGLSEGIHTLLTQEMQQIEKGMQTIFSHMVRGEYEPIAETATKIEESFIFKKRLTDAQRKELRAALPAGFIALDRSFHETAGALSAAAEFDDREKVVESFTVMVRTCVQCHSTYAAHRFGTFAEE